MTQVGNLWKYNLSILGYIINIYTDNLIFPVEEGKGIFCMGGGSYSDAIAMKTKGPRIAGIYKMLDWISQWSDISKSHYCMKTEGKDFHKNGIYSKNLRMWSNEYIQEYLPVISLIVTELYIKEKC